MQPGVRTCTHAERRCAAGGKASHADAEQNTTTSSTSCKGRASGLLAPLVSVEPWRRHIIGLPPLPACLDPCQTGPQARACRASDDQAGKVQARCAVEPARLLLQLVASPTRGLELCAQRLELLAVRPLVVDHGLGGLQPRAMTGGRGLEGWGRARQGVSGSLQAGGGAAKPATCNPPCCCRECMATRMCVPCC